MGWDISAGIAILKIDTYGGSILNFKFKEIIS